MRLTILCALGALLAACGVPTTPDATSGDAGSDAAVPLDSGSDVDAGCGNGSQRECYSGPAATRGVGVCRAGVQRCFEGSWGACVGEATPGLEVCGNGADDDCNGVVDCPADAGPEASDAATDARANCVDGDGDGYGMGAGCLGADCNDADPLVHPGASERCNGADDDCNGTAETAANAPSLDAWCVSSNPIAADERPAYAAYPPRCTGPGRQVTVAPYPPRNSFACQSCRMLGSELACVCWRPTSTGELVFTNCIGLP